MFGIEPLLIFIESRIWDKNEFRKRYKKQFQRENIISQLGKTTVEVYEEIVDLQKKIEKGAIGNVGNFIQ